MVNGRGTVVRGIHERKGRGLSENAGDYEKLGHLNSLMPHFQEASVIHWPSRMHKALEELYELAKREDPGDPVSWVVDFSTTIPRRLEVAGESTYVGKVLVMAKHYVNTKRDKLKLIERSRGKADVK